MDVLGVWHEFDGETCLESVWSIPAISTQSLTMLGYPQLVTRIYLVYLLI